MMTKGMLFSARKQAVRAFCALGARSILVVWFANLVRFVAVAVRYLPSRRSGLKYQEVDGQIGTHAAATDHNDLGLNFFSRLVLEYRYSFVMELGAFAANRSFKLAKLFPQTKVYALDITRDFAVEREMDGVTLGPNTLPMIESIAKRYSGGGMICAHGTLCYYPQPDLEALFDLAFSLELDIAFSEPNVSMTEHTRPRSFRRTKTSYYHPYIPMLLRAGYRLPDGGGQQVRDCWGRYAEERTFIFARHPS